MSDPASDPNAAALARMPEVWQRLLATHVADRHGRCRGCRWQTRSADLWPCNLYLLAAAAQRMASAPGVRSVAHDLEGS
jgi:hypothetical protein